MSRDYYLQLAKGFGLRVNHHNVQDLINRCEAYGYECQARTLKKIIGSDSDLTTSIFIGPFLDLCPDHVLAMPEKESHDISTLEGAQALVDHLETQSGTKQIPVFVKRAKLPPEDERDVEEVTNGDVGHVDFRDCRIKPGSIHFRDVAEDRTPIVLDPGRVMRIEEVHVGPIRLNFRQLQEEHYAWVNHNFPEQLRDPTRKDDGFDGLVEEVGELARARLKRRQGIRYTKEQCDELEQDAIGDAIIFLTSYCTAHGIDLQTVVEKTWNEVKKRDWIKYPKTGTPIGEEFAEFPEFPG